MAEIEKPRGSDFYFFGATLLTLGVVLGIAVTIVRWWRLLLDNSYAPAPLILLAATAAYLGWYWIRMSRDRVQLALLERQCSGDPTSSQIVRQARMTLYRGSFISSMLVLLLMMALHLLIGKV